jgi:hypothetical protein
VTLIPERFGCGLKVSYGETLDFQKSVGRSDAIGTNAFPLEVGGRRAASSVDKVFQVGIDAERFCDLALRHAAADLIVEGARPLWVDACFEFGPELATKSDRVAFSSAFFDAAARQSLAVGKCHSTFGGSTALTLCVGGELFYDFSSMPEAGVALLSKKLGGLRHLYLAALKGKPPKDEILSHLLSRCGEVLPKAAFCAATDVSGFGFAGALWDLAFRYCLSFTVSDAQHLMLGPESTAYPPCLEAELNEWALGGSSGSATAALFRSRELCGPLVLLCAKDELSMADQAFTALGLSPPLRIGEFVRGEPKVEVQK